MFNTARGFAQIPIIIGLILALFVSGGIGYVAFQNTFTEDNFEYTPDPGINREVEDDIAASNSQVEENVESNHNTQQNLQTSSQDKEGCADASGPCVAMKAAHPLAVVVEYANVLPEETRIEMIQIDSGRDWGPSTDDRLLEGEGAATIFLGNICVLSGMHKLRASKIRSDVILAESEPFYFSGSLFEEFCRTNLDFDLEDALQKNDFIIYPQTLLPSKLGANISGEGVWFGGFATADTVDVVIKNTAGQAVAEEVGIEVDKTNGSFSFYSSRHGTWNYITDTFFPAGLYTISASSGGKTIQETLKVAQQKPSCQVSTNKSKYLWGESVKYIWTSVGADGVTFFERASSNSNLNLPKGNLPPNGSFITMPDPMGGPQRAVLLVYNEGGFESCEADLEFQGF